MQQVRPRNATDNSNRRPKRFCSIWCKEHLSRNFSIVLEIFHVSKNRARNATRIRLHIRRFNFNIAMVDATCDSRTTTRFRVTCNTTNVDIAIRVILFQRIIRKVNTSWISTAQDSPCSKTCNTAHVTICTNRTANNIAIENHGITSVIFRNARHVRRNATRIIKRPDIRIINIHVPDAGM